MKPQNLIIFKDFKIKIGDFGCSINFTDNSTDETKVYLRGVTKGYSSKEICDLYKEDLEFQRRSYLKMIVTKLS